MTDFLHMDGYAAFVWPSFLLTAAVLVGNWLQPWLRLRRLHREIRDELLTGEQRP